MTALAIAATLAPAYLLGAMPWSLWVARARGVELRRVGSGNLGATNVYRVLGPALGVLVLALDVAKGALAVVWGGASPWAAHFPGGAAWAVLAAAAAAVAGHVYTAFAGFRGGKGVATTVGAWFALAPIATLIAAAVFALVLLLARRVSLASIAMSLALPFAVAATVAGPLEGPLVLFSALAAVLIIVRHRANLRRLAAGTEPAFTFRRPSRGEGTASSERAGGEGGPR